MLDRALGGLAAVVGVSCFIASGPLVLSVLDHIGDLLSGGYDIPIALERMGRAFAEIAAALSLLVSALGSGPNQPPDQAAECR